MKQKTWSIIFYGYTAFMSGLTILAAVVYMLTNDPQRVLLNMLMFTVWTLLAVYKAQELAKE